MHFVRKDSAKAARSDHKHGCLLRFSESMSEFLCQLRFAQILVTKSMFVPVDLAGLGKLG